MDILNTLKSVLGGGTGNKQPDLMSTVLNLIGGQSGGLGGLVKQFAAKGLGDVDTTCAIVGGIVALSAEEIPTLWLKHREPLPT